MSILAQRFLDMTNIVKHQPTVELLLNVGAQQTSPTEFTLPMDIWLKQRETIRSSLEGVGNKQIPLLSVTHSCQCCQATITTRASQLVKSLKQTTSGGLFCSPSCSSKRQTPYTKSCVVCGTTFRPKSRSAQACSKSCAGKLRKILKPIPCNHCGKEFQPRGTHSVYCSMDCKNAAHSLRMRARGNPQYRGGIAKNRYQKLVAQTIYLLRPMVRELDNGECVICKSTDNLQMHHVDMDATNNSLKNLATLCKNCHETLHAAERELPRRHLFPELKSYAENRGYGIFK